MPSGSGDGETTGASMAGSRTVDRAAVRVLLVDRDHHAVEGLADPGPAARRPRPGRGPSARSGAASWPVRCIVFGRSGSAACTQSGHVVAGAQRDAHLDGVAVGEATQRRGDVGVLRGQPGVPGLGRHLAVEGDVPAAAQQPGAGHDQRGLRRAPSGRGCGSGRGRAARPATRCRAREPCGAAAGRRGGPASGSVRSRPTRA